MHILYTYIYIYISRDSRVQGISRNYAQKLRGGISSIYALNSRITVAFFRRLARNRETRKACSGTFAKLAPQNGHAFLDAI